MNSTSTYARIIENLQFFKSKESLKESHIDYNPCMEQMMTVNHKNCTYLFDKK